MHLFAECEPREDLLSRGSRAGPVPELYRFGKSYLLRFRPPHQSGEVQGTTRRDKYEERVILGLRRDSLEYSMGDQGAGASVNPLQVRFRLCDLNPTTIATPDAKVVDKGPLLSSTFFILAFSCRWNLRYNNT